MIALVASLAPAVAQDQPPPPPPVAAVVASPESVADQGETSFRVSLVPGVGIGADPDLVVDGFGVGVVSKASATRGFVGDLGLSFVDGEAAGVQAALGLSVAGSVDGLQGAVGASWATEDVTFAQVSGFANYTGGDLDGVQGSTFLNVTAGSARGLQVAMANVALGEASGGVQAGFFDLARGFDGTQLAFVNVADRVNGLQLGFVNVGREVKGVQLGLVNVAKTSEVSIAPLNFVADGLHRVDVWTSESSVLSGAVKFGSRNVYTLVGAGWVNPTQSWWTFGGGLGVHLPVGPLWVELDDSVWGLADGPVVAVGGYNKVRLQVGGDLVAGHLAPFAGVSLNTWVGDGAVSPRALGLPQSRDPENRVVTWPGFQAGLSF